MPNLKIKEIKDMFSGKEIEYVDDTFGHQNGIVQQCKKCKNDHFIVIYQHYKKTHNIQLICPKCDTPHVAVQLQKITVGGFTR